MPEAFQSGQLIYLGGVSPTVRGDVTAQTRNILEQLQSSLRAAGSSLDHVVSVLVFLRAASDFGAMNDAYRSFWSRDFPTRTTVVVDLSSPDVGLAKPLSMRELRSVLVDGRTVLFLRLFRGRSRRWQGLGGLR